MVNIMAMKQLSFFLILLILVFVNAEKLKFIKITKVNDGNVIKPGEGIILNFKILENSQDPSFDLIIRDEGKSVFEKVETITNQEYKFNKDNEYFVNVTIPTTVKSGDYKIYGYIDSEKISDSYSVKVDNPNPTTPTTTEENAVPSTEPNNTNNNSTVTATSDLGAPLATSTAPANISTTGNQQADNQKGLNFNWSNILIIGGIVFIILLLFGILFCCCIKDTKSEIHELSPAVSEPQLVSSSSPINAIPLHNNYNKNNNQFNSPGMSPIDNSNSNISDAYQNQETQGLTARERQKKVQQPSEMYSRDTIYSNNSAYLSDTNGAEEDMSSPSPSYYFQVFKPHQVYRVLYDFQPSLPDEMEIQAGDIIRTEETFEDGWAFGINMTSGKRGTFPMNCLEDDYATDNDEKSIISERSQSQSRSRRTSSLQNSQNAQAIQMMLRNNNNNQSFQKYYLS
ncbi:hypothetical protein BCR32DRAFT_263868 [Anaeromyces robustus]|jgi:hypothetical protein|uniref:SH3 domain-containing protein n=1 Tax=Anaeromyces robustus TaxID=1754192 RepID=A0A1Y1XQG9_9FUNG|nr:hypothetical protein BCR32DRAFT_263868 [Anaeromyces robustus]|eukprot:ORX87999.1 hypothetical protein BCR32DRAFT_263868 [Anaeromyces robustus]